MAGALIAKAILGSIGGAFEGAAKPYSGGVSTAGIETNKVDADKESEKTEPKKEVSESSDNSFNSLQKRLDEKDRLNEMNFRAGFNLSDKFKNAPQYNKAFGADISDNIGQTVGGLSDVNLKEIYGADISDRIIEDFAKIAAIDFKYNDKARELYNEDSGVDDKEHTGVKAQDLESTPTTEAVVSEDEHGFKKVDTQQLTMTNTAVLSELARRILELEMQVKTLLESRSK